jgi:phage baseplate assembly protein W
MVDYVVNEGKTVAKKDLYSDLNLQFTPHPITGDVTRKTDTDAVRRSVRNIVMTNYYERPFKPGFGGNLIGLLFNLDTDRGLEKVSEKLTKTIETFEPRVKNVTIRVNNEGMNTNTLELTIFYNIINGSRNQELSLTVSRAR